MFNTSRVSKKYMHLNIKFDQGLPKGANRDLRSRRTGSRRTDHMPSWSSEHELTRSSVCPLARSVRADLKLFLERVRCVVVYEMKMCVAPCCICRFVVSDRIICAFLLRK